jgi:hypothetical protein
MISLLWCVNVSVDVNESKRNPNRCWIKRCRWSGTPPSKRSRAGSALSLSLSLFLRVALSRALSVSLARSLAFSLSLYLSLSLFLSISLLIALSLSDTVVFSFSLAHAV